MDGGRGGLEKDRERRKENGDTFPSKDFLIQFVRARIGLILENFVGTVGKIEKKREEGKKKKGKSS